MSTKDLSHYQKDCLEFAQEITDYQIAAAKELVKMQFHLSPQTQQYDQAVAAITQAIATNYLAVITEKHR
jgi:O6-methylguanine-DNA--protein-cysteine methyltransferase